MKAIAAAGALPFVTDHALIGVGHGTTVRRFVERLSLGGHVLKAAVAASSQTAAALREHGIAVVPLAEATTVPVYVDGCDQVDPMLRMLKGRGGALTGEKLIAARAESFVCIADETKYAERLGSRPVVVEVARSALPVAAAALRELGGDPELRRGFETDQGNPVLDVRGLDVATDPLALERAIDAITGVVECGIFASRPADVLLLGTSEGLREIRRA